MPWSKSKRELPDVMIDCPYIANSLWGTGKHPRRMYDAREQLRIQTKTRPQIPERDRGKTDRDVQTPDRDLRSATIDRDTENSRKKFFA